MRQYSFHKVINQEVFIFLSIRYFLKNITSNIEMFYQKPGRKVNFYILVKKGSIFFSSSITANSVIYLNRKIIK